MTCFSSARRAGCESCSTISTAPRVIDPRSAGEMKNGVSARRKGIGPSAFSSRAQYRR